MCRIGVLVILFLQVEGVKHFAKMGHVCDGYMAKALAQSVTVEEIIQFLRLNCNDVM